MNVVNLLAQKKDEQFLVHPFEYFVSFFRAGLQ
jgi:hypothetical protein